jgi:hypothetical protein
LGGRVPECKAALPQLLSEAVRLTDLTVASGADRAEYARALLNQFALAHTRGTPLPPAACRALVHAAHDFCRQEFDIPVDEAQQNLQLLDVLDRRGAELFAEQHRARAQPMSSEALGLMLEQPVRAQLWVDEWQRVQGQRGRVDVGPYAGAMGTVVGAVRDADGSKLRVRLDNGRNVEIATDRFFAAE